VRIQASKTELMVPEVDLPPDTWKCRLVVMNPDDYQCHALTMNLNPGEGYILIEYIPTKIYYSFIKLNLFT
jgi:hypothetical protein